LGLFLSSAVDLLGTALALWLGVYLLARGYRSSLTLRAVVMLLALGLFFLSAFLNLHFPVMSTAVARAVCLVMAFLAWHSLSFRMLPPAERARRAWLLRVGHSAGLASVVFLVGLRPIFAEADNSLMVSGVQLTVGYLLYGLGLMVLTAATLAHLWRGVQLGLNPYQRLAFIATLVAVGPALVAYLFINMLPPVPRIVQDLLLLTALAIFSYAIARHQVLVERRTTLQDFPISGLAIGLLALVYALVAWWESRSAAVVALVVVLAVLTHATYDLVRGFLEGLLYRRDGGLRRQLRTLAHDVGSTGSNEGRLNDGLSLLCQTVHAAGGFIALAENGQHTVAASLRSLPVGAALPAAALPPGDVGEAPPTLRDQVTWLAPAYLGAEAVGVVGLGPRVPHGSYLEHDLALLVDTADWVSRVAPAQSRQEQERETLSRLAAEMPTREVQLQTATEDLRQAMSVPLADEVVSEVEDALRHLAEYAELGESPLVARLGLAGDTHVARGKALRERLEAAIEGLRPPGPTPKEPWPREWQGYAAVRLAYVEDVPNREIMARLYVAESTFARVRRKAVRAVARSVVERGV
jgi:hypothetical protein